MTTNLKIEGMHCKMCAGHVRRALEAVGGVTSASVDLESNSATVEHENASTEAFIAALKEEDYAATVLPS